MQAQAPNLYTHFRLDPEENSTALGVILAGRDADLANRGVEQTSPRRKELDIAYAVLSDETRRQLYNEALEANRTIYWEHLEHLGNFDDWPQSYTGWTEPDWDPAGPNGSSLKPPPPPNLSPPNLSPPKESSPYPNMFAPTVNPKVNAAYPVLGSATGAVRYTEMVNRPTSSTRVGMALADLVVASTLAGIVLSVLSIFGDIEGILPVSLMAVLTTAYMVVPEVKLGGSPVKILCGYTVRDVNTHQRLTYQQSLKRNWFRAAQILPGLGTVLGFGGALASLITMDVENGHRGSHDRFADAEVVKKR